MACTSKQKQERSEIIVNMAASVPCHGRVARARELNPLDTRSGLHEGGGFAASHKATLEASIPVTCRRP